MTTISPRDLPAARPVFAPLLARATRALRSRVVWFVLERYSASAFGFLLTATLTRGAQLDRLAEYLAAFALTSVFEPLFAASISSYLLKLVRTAETPLSASQTFRTVFWMMQGVAIVFVGAAFAFFSALPGDHRITALFFLQIVFTPWKLFSAPLIAQDRFMRVTPVQVSANVIAGTARVAAALVTHNLYLVPVLMCLEPIITGPILKARSGIRLFERAPLSGNVAATVVRQLPSLMGVMVLICLFYRSPVMLARLDLGAADVVRIALALQVVAVLGVIQSALADSLIGPLAHALDADDRFNQLLAIGSTVLLLYGVAVCALLGFAGEPLLTLAFGKRAEMIGPIVGAAAPLCLVGGYVRLANTVINLRARPAMMIVVWAGAIAGQGVAAVLLARSHAPIVIAAMTPLSLAVGLALALVFSGARGSIAQVIFGFRHVLVSPSQWSDAAAVMLGGRSEAARTGPVE